MDLGALLPLYNTTHAVYAIWRMRQLTKEEFLSQLQDRVDDEGSQRSLARKLNISPGYLNDVLQRRKEPREKLLNSLGLQAVTHYVTTSGKTEEKEEESKP